jgi:hypothetical protein
MSPRILIALLPVVVAGAARAESPRNMMLGLHGGTYAPDVDSAFETATPWKDTFDGSAMTLLRFDLDYALWQGFGTLALGGGVGYGWVDGKARDSEGEATSDEVGFNLMPLSLSLVYRFDWAATRHDIPFVPYAKAGLSGGLWWATDAKGEVSNARDGTGSGREGQGLTLGWHAGAGLMFLLDVFSSGMAAEFDNESGVNNSFVFAEYVHNVLDDFGADDSIVLSSDAFSFGLAFEF